MPNRAEEIEPWIECRLGDVVELKRGYDLSSAVRQSGNIPIVSSGGISGWHSEYKAKGPGVVTGRYGTIGKVFYVEEDFWPLNTTLYVTDFKGANERFVSYFLKTLDFNVYSDKAAVPGVNRNDLHRALISWPGRSEQDRIAALLASLDARIEHNKKMILTLEETARALFQSWFVDFDPVLANAEGRTPDLPPDIAGLFPNLFGDDGLPEGWRKDSIYDVADVIYGAPFASEMFNNLGIGRPLVRIRDLPTQRGGQFTNEVHKNEYIIEPGQIVVGMDGEFRAYLWQGDPALMNQRVCCFKPKAKINRGFLWLSLIPLLDVCEQSAVGTTVIHLGKKDIDQFRVLSTCTAVLQAFGNIVEPMIDEIVDLGKMSRGLAQVRDTLLPNLITGQVRIPRGLQKVAAA
jgi:type I restriction enzyme S subunit